MEEVAKRLRELFDEMLTQVGAFKRKSYSSVFETAYEKYKSLPEDLIKICEGAEETKKESCIEEIAGIIPDHGLEKMKELSKKEKERMYMDYNLNMAVYVVPILNYNNNEWCRKITEKMVEIWNQKKVSELTLSHSTYEEIRGGFKSRLCYITTAVCRHMDKPDDCYELTTLRKYRDEYMMQTDGGRGIVEDYYEIAPGIVLMVDMQKNADQIYDQIYQSYLLPCIQMIETGENKKCQDLYMDMVNHLQREYLHS